MPNGRGKDLRDADLRDADLERGSLFRADLTDAALTGADLRNTSLVHGVLIRANFSGAVLTGAVLTGADLIDANLRGARSFRANLQDTDLGAANLKRMMLDGVGAQNLGQAIHRQRPPWEHTNWGNTTCPDGTMNNGIAPCSGDPLIPLITEI